MVEPIAATVFNKLLPGRTAFKRSASLQSLIRVVSSSRRKTLMPGFFTPQPRRVSSKGKERAVDSHSCRIWECQQWLSCSAHHSVWCPRHCRSLMLKELNYDDHAPLRYRRSRQVGNPHTRRKPSSLASRVFSTQRRHASSSPKQASHTLNSTGRLFDPTQYTQKQIAHELDQLVRRQPKDFDPQLAWDYYTSLVQTPSRLVCMTLADQILNAAEQSYTEVEGSDMLKLWGPRALSVLETLDPRDEYWDDWKNRLYARAMAAANNIDEAIQFARAAEKTIEPKNAKNLLRVWELMLLSTYHYNGPLAVLDFTVSNWGLLETYISENEPEVEGQRPLGYHLRRTAMDLVAQIEDPSEAVSSTRDHFTNEEREVAGRLLIDIFCFRFPRDALGVLNELKKQQITLPDHYKLLVVRHLANQGIFGNAQSLYSSMTEHESYQAYLSTGLYLHSQQGSKEAATKVFQQLEARGWVQPHDITNHLFAYARAGDVDGVQERFDEHFPRGPDLRRLNSPLAAHYSPVLYALSKRGFSDDMTKWLADLAEAGLKPDIYTFTLVLQALALGDDLQGALSVLKTMEREGIKPNAVAYSIVIALLSHRRDAFGAEAVFKRALQDGIVPDTKMVTSLMNAHVESGSWKGVIRVYDFISSTKMRNRIRVTIEVYNTLLKAYVLSAAPFSVVAQLFQTLEDSKVKPDVYTFALLIQSACDNGKMHLAADMFWRMDEMSGKKERDLNITVYMLTILMTGFLKNGDKVKAKAVYDEIVERGIEPTAVTFSSILKAYGNEGTEQSLKIAEAFIRDLVTAPPKEQAWNIPSYGRRHALQAIYSPVINAYARQEKFDDVERMFEEMLSHGAPPSLGTLTMVLDACRRIFNVQGVLEIWPQILQLGLQHLNALPDDIKGDHKGFTLGSNILCVPLSIYIDALSAAGFHSDIAATWGEMRSLGFSYDAHNYNHLVVALVRAGQVERAFEVVDRVLLPNHLRAKRFVPTRNANPLSPLIFKYIAQHEEGPQHSQDANDQESSKEPEEPKEEPKELEDPDELPSDGLDTRPVRNVDRRALMVRKSTRNLDYEDIFGKDQIYKHDLARPLHVMHQLSPSWGMWRPHAAVLTVLLHAHTKLERGELIYPITEKGAAPMPRIESENYHAWRVLKHIYKEYPIAVQVVLKHENYEKRRLGVDYERVYNWT